MADTPLMVLGPVKFSISGAAYDQLERTTNYTWARQNVLGRRTLTGQHSGGPALQYISPGDDTIHLQGTMYPEFNGGRVDITFMRMAAGMGIPLPMVGGSGFVFGLWVIESIAEIGSVFVAGGSPRKISFNLSLRKHVAVL